MMYLENMDLADFELIAQSEERMSYKYKRDMLHATKEPSYEAEVVFFPKTRALCIQGHPEYLGPEHPTSKWIHNLIKLYQPGVL